MIVQRRNRRVPARRGFTLMEVLVVVAILVILAGTASIFVFRFLDQSKLNRARADIETLTRACQSYKVTNDGYPESLQELVTPSDGKKPYLEKSDAIYDPWSSPTNPRMYQYDPSGNRNGGTRPDIWTVSPDGEEVGNWDMAKPRG